LILPNTSHPNKKRERKNTKLEVTKALIMKRVNIRATLSSFDRKLRRICIVKTEDNPADGDFSPVANHMEFHEEDGGLYVLHMQKFGLSQ
jgi:hypothetical protein